MGIKIENMKVYTCDNPDCGKQTAWDADVDEGPLGIEGKVMENFNGGGRGTEFWACSRKCLRKAVIASLDDDGNW